MIAALGALCVSLLGCDQSQRADYGVIYYMNSKLKAMKGMYHLYQASLKADSNYSLLERLGPDAFIKPETKKIQDLTCLSLDIDLPLCMCSWFKMPIQPLDTVAGVDFSIGSLVGVSVVVSLGLSLVGFLGFGSLHFLELLLEASKTHLSGVVLRPKCSAREGMLT